MPVPSTINDLSTTAGSNSPAGSESPALIDDYLRAHGSFIATLRDEKVSKTGDETIAGTKTFNSNPAISAGTTNGVLYLNGSKAVTSGSGLVFDGTSLGLGVTPSAWGSSAKAFEFSGGSVVGFGTGSLEYWYNAFNNGTSTVYKFSGTGAMQYKQTGTGHTWYTAPYGTAGQPISFTQAMTLDASGRLLVGITSAAASGKLIVKGDSVANFYNANETAVSNITYVDAQTFSIGAFHASGSNFIVKTNPSGGGETERLRVDSTGNVGISLSSPSKQLHLGSIIPNGTAGESAIIKLGSAGAEIVGYQNTFADNIDIVFKPRAPSGVFEAARIDSSGRLLVGTTNAFGKVGIAYNPAIDYGLSIAPTSDTSAYAITFRNATTTVVGSVLTTATTTAYNTSSDYRLKHDIAPMQNALQRVAALKPVTYKWNADNSDGEGFIAHELAEVCPQAVTGEKDAVDADGKPVYQGIDTSFLVATLTAAIQEQQAIITELRSRIEALEAK